MEVVFTCMPMLILIKDGWGLGIDGIPVYCQHMNNHIRLMKNTLVPINMPTWGPYGLYVGTMGFSWAWGSNGQCSWGPCGCYMGYMWAVVHG